MESNMTEVLEGLAQTIRLCRGYKNVESIIPVTVRTPDGYTKEIARVTYTNGHSVNIDIGCDSGMAAIYDISKYFVHH